MMAARRAVKWIDKDLGWKEIEKRIREMEKKPHVTVGIQGDKAAMPHQGGSERTNGDIAAIHEFGIGVPKRSFVLGYADEEKSAIHKKSRFLVSAILGRKMTLKAALDTLGLFVQNGMKNRIKRHIAPPNAPATVRKKKSNTPLVDLGTLVGSITYKAYPRGGR